MANIECFTKLGRPDLQRKLDELVKGGRPEMEAAREVILNERNALNEKMNEIRTAINADVFKKSAKIQLEPAVQIEDISPKLKEINDRYEEKKTVAQQAAVPEPTQEPATKSVEGEAKPVI